MSPPGDPLTLWPLPARREDLETLFPDQAEIEDPLREWRRNRGRQNTGDGGLEAKDRGPPAFKNVGVVCTRVLPRGELGIEPRGRGLPWWSNG